MAKSTSVFVCQNCEHTHSKWQGQCDSCGEWNTLVEEVSLKVGNKGQAGGGNSKARRQLAANGKISIKLSEVDGGKGPKKRISTRIGEMDRVLGSSLLGFGEQKKTSNQKTSKSESSQKDQNQAGIVPGSVILIGGEPGIGKSTLLTQLVVNLASEVKGRKIMYVSGEESPNQISLRVNRIFEYEQKNAVKSNGIELGSAGKKNAQENLIFVTSTDVDQVCQLISKEKPYLVIVDSVQTLSTGDLTGVAGSPGQIREAADRITSTVKPLNIPTFFVGHVTKDGVIAGPKVLEHIVDAVLELSGDRSGSLRLLRSVKNRFGATDEVGVFRFNEAGLEEVSNPSEIFLEEANQGTPGSSTVCVMEGTRPLLAEVQALVLKSQLAMPRRVGRGIELSRIQVLSAILEKHANLPLGFCDIFLSAAGGFKIKEPAVDLGLAVAIASSLKEKSLPKNMVFIGEIGLLGEIRGVSHLKRRIKEAKRLGYKKIVSRESHKRVRDVLKELKLG